MKIMYHSFSQLLELDLYISFAYNQLIYVSLRDKCPYSEFFWSVFSRIRAQYEPQKLRIRTLFTQCFGLRGNDSYQNTVSITRNILQVFRKKIIGRIKI